MGRTPRRRRGEKHLEDAQKELGLPRPGPGLSKLRADRGPSCSLPAGPGLGWLRLWHRILPRPCGAPRPAPFRVRMLSLLPSHCPGIYSSSTASSPTCWLVQSPGLFLMENGKWWCWPSCQLLRVALMGVNSKGPGEAQTPPSPRTPQRLWGQGWQGTAAAPMTSSCQYSMDGLLPLPSGC